MDQLKALASKAKEAWGNNVGQWTSSQISEAGKILGKLLIAISHSQVILT